MAIALRSSTAGTTGSVKATSITVTVPTGTVSGDVMVVVISSNNAPTITSAGWTSKLALPNATNEKVAFMYKVASGSEPTSYSFSVGATTRSICYWCGSYSGVDNTTPFDTVTSTITGTGLSATIPSMTLTNTNEYLIAAMTSSGGNGITSTFSTTNGAFTEEADEHNTITTSTANSLGVYDGLFASSGASGSLLITQTTSMTYAAGMIALNPAAGSTGQIKAYDGASFIAKPVKVWNGSAWVIKPLKRYDGSIWVTTPY